jgi:thioredoxin reductase (NADPH)
MDGWGAEVTEEPRREPVSERAVMEELQTQLEPLFKDMPNEISLILFTRPGKNDIFSSATRFLIRAIREVAPTISLREYDLSHKLALQWNVDRSPTLLVDPDRYRVRWLGAPIGEQAQAFVQALLMIGRRRERSE